MAKPKNLPPCYGREWNPEDQESCSPCLVASACSEIFARGRLDEAARELGYDSPQAAPAEKLASLCGTSVAAIEQARVLRLQPSSARKKPSEPPPSPESPLPAVAPPSTPSEPASTTPSGVSSAESSPAPSAPKRRGRPPKAKAETPAASAPQPESGEAAPAPTIEPGLGFSVNFTTGQVEHVRWPGTAPLFQIPGIATPVLQATYWAQDQGCWVWLVGAATGRQIPEGVREVVWSDLVSKAFAAKLGG